MTIIGAGRTLQQLASSSDVQWQRRDNGVVAVNRDIAATDTARDVAGYGGNRPCSRWDVTSIS